MADDITRLTSVGAGLGPKLDGKRWQTKAGEHEKDGGYKTVWDILYVQVLVALLFYLFILAMLLIYLQPEGVKSTSQAGVVKKKLFLDQHYSTNELMASGGI